MADDKKQNSNNLYTYLMFEKFWNEHKEFLKLQIKYGPLPLKKHYSKFAGQEDKENIKNENNAKDKITKKREEYYSSLRKIPMRAFDDLRKNDKSLSWDNGNIDENKVKEATWLTFNLLIDRCEGEGEWGRVAEVFKIIIRLLCGNDNKLPYNAMGYMFFVLSSDISLQAIYNGLSLLYKEYEEDNYNIADYKLENTPKKDIKRPFHKF